VEERGEERGGEREPPLVCLSLSEHKNTVFKTEEARERARKKGEVFLIKYELRYK